MNSPAPKILACVFVYNEGEKLQATLARFPERRNYDVIVMDDGSTDEARAIIDHFPFVHLRHDTNRGVGAAFRTAFAYALERGYDIFIPMAGNGKMHPEDIPSLLAPILEDGYDYVQGSRYMPGGFHEHLPQFRKLAIPIVTRLIGLLIGYRGGTDITCGFRAYKLALIRDPRLDINQSWLDRYEMEYYIHYYAVTLGYRITEAPVAMRYPASKKNYSKIRVFTGWWSMLRPWVYLTLGLRK
ncbi:MAG: glycosyltransferase family 2 protein [Candidatus Zixiibacteriota bacterium]